MSLPTNEPSNRVVPAQLGFLAIYNPSLGMTDETLENQIVYYFPSASRERKQRLSENQDALHNAIREQNNEQLRQIGLAQGMVEFGRSFSDGRAVDTVETEKSRIVLHELEAGWWILASINLTILPATSKAAVNKGKAKAVEPPEKSEYSSREVKPAILILGDLLRAHSTFLLHHASSMSALFVRTRRSKFIGLLGSYWDTFLSSWNVMMHGNPANSLYGGMKVAACGELGMGVGEEERGSGEREVLEGFVGRIDGLVDVVVSRFGGKGLTSSHDTASSKQDYYETTPMGPWLGSGNEPAAEDGAVFLGTGALSRKSLRDVSHWIEDLYRWGPYAYGVIDNPTSNRRTKKTRKGDPAARRKELSPDAKKNSRQVYGLSINEPPQQQTPTTQDSASHKPPIPILEVANTPSTSLNKTNRPPIHRGPPSYASSDSDSARSYRFVHYLKLGYGTHWSLGGASAKREGDDSNNMQANPNPTEAFPAESQSRGTVDDGIADSSQKPHDDSVGHYMIGLMGDMESAGGGQGVEINAADHANVDDDNVRLLLRTLTVELEREEDARAEADISIDLGNGSKEPSSKHNGSEHTGTSNASFESQDRNKTKKLRVVVYVNKPFIFVFLFELRTAALALAGLYRSLHNEIRPLLKPLLSSTSFRVSKPEVNSVDGSSTPIYDLIWDSKLLTINSTIPNIPDPFPIPNSSPESSQWSRIEALNTHMQIINTYIASSTDPSELERTCKTSRGWWVVWTRIPDAELCITPLISGQVKIPAPIAEDGVETPKSVSIGPATSRGTSTFGASLYSGPAHPFLETTVDGEEAVSKHKEIFLIRRASDYLAAKSASRFAGSALVSGSEAGWTTSGPGKLAHGIGVDTKRYIEALLKIN